MARTPFPSRARSLDGAKVLPAEAAFGRIAVIAIVAMLTIIYIYIYTYIAMIAIYSYDREPPTSRSQGVHGSRSGKSERTKDFGPHAAPVGTKLHQKGNNSSNSNNSTSNNSSNSNTIVTIVGTSRSPTDGRASPRLSPHAARSVDAARAQRGGPQPDWDIPRGAARRC